MRVNFLIIIYIVANCSIIFANENISKITPEEIKEYCKYLSSDYFKGRDTPSAELDSAGRFIANLFKDFGLKPIKNSYFQDIYFTKNNLSLNSSLSIDNNGIIRHFALKKDFVPLEETEDCNINSAGFVFVGYGAFDKDLGIDDYINIEAKDKIVIAFKGAHPLIDKQSFKNLYANANKIELAKSKGAKAILLVDRPLNRTKLRPNGFPWPSIYLDMPKECLPLKNYIKGDDFGAVSIGESIVEAIFGTVDSLKKYQTIIDSSNKFSSFEIPKLKCSLKIELVRDIIKASNIIGMIEGSSDEFVVVGAHYDHIGYVKNSEKNVDSIFNGADDNASGVAGLLSISKRAKHFKNIDRSVVFVAFCGEEKGLLGSKAFVKSDLLEMNKCSAFLNLDMLGGNDKDTASFIGDSYFPNLFQIISEANAKLDEPFAIVKSDESFFYRGDQESFQEYNIPSIMFCTGETRRYHTVDDEYYTLDFNKAERLANICLNSLFNVVDRNKYKKEVKLNFKK